MSVNLDFGNYNNYSVSESRMSRMLQADKKSATYMNVWERFKDLFRTDKKSNAYNELYNIVHNTEGYDKLDTFNKLKSCAKSEYQHLFRKEILCNDVVFFIGHERISETSIQKLINVSEQTPLCNISMSRPEQDFFLEMLDTLREKESQSIGRRLSYTRDSASYEHRHDMSVLYRPQENIDMEGTEWQMAESITSSEEDVLRCLNAGSMVPFSQFSFMGYEKTASGVEFTMVHPLISFLQGTYVKNIVDAFSFTEINSGFLKVLNEGYEAYHDNKTEVDTVLKKIHHQHGDTLNISVQGQNRNKLFGSVYFDGQYEMEGNNFSNDLNEAFSVIFEKFTDPNLHLSEDTWFAIHDTHF